jgi:23S rRNA pseudouridine2605 synthase
VPRPKSPAPEPERLQKILARLGLASRREAEEWIRAGRLTVNGEKATLGMRAGNTDKLKLDGRLIHRYEASGSHAFLCHRSPGESTEMLDRLPRNAGKRFVGVSPMPRIDGGLELVTSDGTLAAKLQRAAHQLNSEYSVRVRGELNEDQTRGILDGVLDRGDRLEVESCEPGGGEGTNRWYTVIARGGSGKDVRQLFERQGALVSRIMRTRLGTLQLDRRLGRGQFRELSREELSALTSAASERRSSVP